MGKHYYIQLEEEERILLMQLIHSGESAARVQTRARILLLSDRSQGNKRTLAAVAESALCSIGTVRNVKRNYSSGGLEAALYEQPHPGATPTFTGEIEAQVTLLACSNPPLGHARWSLRLLADQLIELEYVPAISHVTVGKLLKKQTTAVACKELCIGEPSAAYVAKLEDVLAVYQRPYDAKRPVVCLDEASKVLHSTQRISLPLQPALVQRQDYEYVRHGTAALFLSVEPLRGQRQVRVRAQRTAHEFAEVIRAIVDDDYPQAETVVLVVDNLNTHGPAALYEHFPAPEARRLAAKLEWHFTPEHGSWLNIAECELSVLARQCLRRRIPTIPLLATEVTAWAQRRNNATVIVDWHFTTADTRIKLKRLYPVLKEQISP